jgi:hypothetical protein
VLTKSLKEFGQIEKWGRSTRKERLEFFFLWNLRQSLFGKKWVGGVRSRVDLRRFEGLGME